MLRALYEYAQRHDLALPPGYVNKTVKAYISLSSTDPNEVGIWIDETPVPAPDIGSLAQGPGKSNVLLEKRSVVVPEEETVKSRFFLDALKEASGYDPALGACVRALETPETAAAIRSGLDRHKVKLSDRVSFMVDLRPIVKSEKILPWWKEFRRRLEGRDKGAGTLCLITGEPTTPMRTTPSVQGLLPVGGHSSGDSLIGFDKKAFCSYDLKQAANAPVSEEAMSSVKLALDDLLKDAPILAGMKFVHWYGGEVPADPILMEDFDLFAGSGIDWADDPEDTKEDEKDEAEARREAVRRERDARVQADALVESVRSGEHTVLDAGIRYHILLLSGVGGRIMIRRYETGDYGGLVERLDQWRKDLRLTGPGGTGLLRPCKLFARLIRLVGYRKNDRKASDRVRDELPGLTAVAIHAILTGGPLPDAVAARALAYIRSQMLTGDDDERHLRIPDPRACQWLKVWLIRNEKEDLMEEYDMESRSVPYHCGGLMALFAQIQHLAMPDVNASVIERYYASAIQTPALVIGQLSRMSNHHLEMIDNGWLADLYREKLREVSAAIGQDTLPETLGLKEQSSFAMGYYQMGAKLSKEYRERVAAKKAREAQAAQGQDRKEGPTAEDEAGQMRMDQV